MIKYSKRLSSLSFLKNLHIFCLFSKTSWESNIEFVFQIFKGILKIEIAGGRFLKANLQILFRNLENLDKPGYGRNHRLFSPQLKNGNETRSGKLGKIYKKI